MNYLDECPKERVVSVSNTVSPEITTDKCRTMLLYNYLQIFP